MRHPAVFAALAGTALLAACSSRADDRAWRTVDAGAVTFQVPASAEVGGLDATFEDYPVYRVAGADYAIEIRFEPVAAAAAPDIVTRGDVRLAKLRDEPPYERYAAPTRDDRAGPPVFAIRCDGECPSEVWRIVSSTSVRPMADSDRPPPEARTQAPRSEQAPPPVMPVPD